LQTVWFRAPEVVWDFPDFDGRIDVWSLGLILAEMTGSSFHRVKVEEEHPDRTLRRYMDAILLQLGTPSAAAVTGWRAWASPKAKASRPRKPWPPRVRQELGLIGELLLDALLTWDPAQRPTASQVTAHAFLHPERFDLGGNSISSCRRSNMDSRGFSTAAAAASSAARADR
jgi:serine/threonine protein kinase